MPDWVGCDDWLFKLAKRLLHWMTIERHSKGFRPMTKRNWSKPAQSRLTQARRLFHIAAILATSRGACLSVDNVTEKLQSETGATWHTRTVRRDLKALAELGMADQSTMPRASADPSTFKWRGHSEPLSRVVMCSMEIDASESPEAAEQLAAFLDTLPAPWELDAERHRVATSAARLVAVLETEDRSYLKANLIFVLGKGWVLEQIGDAVESAFDRVKPLSTLAGNMVDEIDQRWELAELAPA